MSTQPASASPSVPPAVEDTHAISMAHTKDKEEQRTDTTTATDGLSAHSAAGAAAAVGSSMLAAAVAASPHTTAVHRVLSIQSSVIFGSEQEHTDCGERAAEQTVRHASRLPSHLFSFFSSLSFSFLFLFSYVGNKASNFPLQLLGFDVDPLHSCQLSNHTGYAHVAGLKTSAKDVRDIASGLDKNNMLRHYSHLLTGYMTSFEFLDECVTLIQRMRKDNPNIFFGQCKHHSFFVSSSSPPFFFFFICVT